MKRFICPFFIFVLLIQPHLQCQPEIIHCEHTSECISKKGPNWACANKFCGKKCSESCLQKRNCTFCDNKTIASLCTNDQCLHPTSERCDFCYTNDDCSECKGKSSCNTKDSRCESACQETCSKDRDCTNCPDEKHFCNPQNNRCVAVAKQCSKCSTNNDCVTCSGKPICRQLNQECIINKCNYCQSNEDCRQCGLQTTCNKNIRKCVEPPRPICPEKCRSSDDCNSCGPLYVCANQICIQKGVDILCDFNKPCLSGAKCISWFENPDQGICLPILKECFNANCGKKRICLTQPSGDAYCAKLCETEKDCFLLGSICGTHGFKHKFCHLHANGKKGFGETCSTNTIHLDDACQRGLSCIFRPTSNKTKGVCLPLHCQKDQDCPTFQDEKRSYPVVCRNILQTRQFACVISCKDHSECPENRKCEKTSGACLHPNSVDP